jgi:hypothetical protein
MYNHTQPQIIPDKSMEFLYDVMINMTSNVH